jgi:3-hydroxyacyl-[acyl-carrier-protein] dehydratase
VSTQYSTSLRVAAQHPSLVGHFPGRPVVPGVLLLDLIVAAAEQGLGRSLALAAAPQVKFQHPLLPEQTAQLTYTLLAERLVFEVKCESRLLARGVLILRSGAAT